jgi:membrane-associated phospholipid phosphatase
MRAAEAIHVVVFGFLTALALVRELPRARRRKAVAIGVAGIAANLAAAFWLPRAAPGLAQSVARDWLPAAMVLLVYWQAGAFFVKVDQKFQDTLARLDARWAAPFLRWLARSRMGWWVAGYLELAYLLCYPMVPFAMGALYALRLGRYADAFWLVVLIPTYVSYGMLPFLQALPPRNIVEPWLEPLPMSAVRRFNLHILRNASIHANTFPSAHVAASTAAALFLASVAPWPVAAGFGVVALGIALGTFAGRYHYAADAVAGVAVALAVWAVARP